MDEEGIESDCRVLQKHCEEAAGVVCEGQDQRNELLRTNCHRQGHCRSGEEVQPSSMFEDRNKEIWHFLLDSLSLIFLSLF